MKAATIREIKEELNDKSKIELVNIALRLAKFKKDNKELLTYLLFESEDEFQFVTGIKQDIDLQFSEINRSQYYFIKKSVRKILRGIKKQIRYSPKKETEVELLIYFCKKLKTFSPPIRGNRVLQNIYHRQIELVQKKIKALHEDLQYDYGVELEELTR